MPLATPADVALGWRTLTADEETRAELLIAVAEAWIRDPSRRPDIAEGDPTGKHVVVEVVRAAMAAPAEWTGHTSYSETMGPWARSGTLSTPAGVLQFLKVHGEMLGISDGPTAVGSFGDPCGYRYPPAGSVGL
ncbi:hypothetical protein F5X71_00370 [Nocardia brasiliensis]|uniref:Head-to-tail adaptor n=1 Tax=Nocardia brasiliensis TaxID=37326 RepID=A0A6G9XJ94_NOCBR|nr:hypothetical protein [Nocardia brasiliensis]QIS00987.1 hypothetical protein F5X71_00370 [Nocardia brasiliensis]